MRAHDFLTIPPLVESFHFLLQPAMHEHALFPISKPVTIEFHHTVLEQIIEQNPVNLFVANFWTYLTYLEAQHSPCLDHFWPTQEPLFPF